MATLSSGCLSKTGMVASVQYRSHKRNHSELATRLLSLVSADRTVAERQLAESQKELAIDRAIIRGIIDDPNYAAT